MAVRAGTGDEVRTLYGETDPRVIAVARVLADLRNSRRVASGEDDVGIIAVDVFDAVAIVKALQGSGFINP